MARRAASDLPVGAAFRDDRIPDARDGEAEHVEARTQVRHRARGEGADTLHPPASSRTSFRIPAAVTASPAPGPWITSGFAW